MVKIHFDFSTKDTTHIRRAEGKVGGIIKPTLNNILSDKKDEFLSNKMNKQEFIFMLGKTLENIGIDVRHAAEDADTIIAATSIENAQSSSVAVFADDTDILVLLLYKAQLNSRPIYFVSKRSKRIWEIGTSQVNIGTKICNSLLAIHPISGCDTTSRITSVGKPSILKKCRSDDELLNQMENFCNASTKDEVIKIIYSFEIGLFILLRLIGAKTLDELRARKYFDKTAVKPESLGPTAKLHLLRCYYQVQIWKENLNLYPSMGVESN